MQTVSNEPASTFVWKYIVVDCEAGQYMSGGGAVNCLDCNPGTYEDEQGATECKVCLKIRLPMLVSKPFVQGVLLVSRPMLEAKCTSCGAGEAGTGENERAFHARKDSIAKQTMSLLHRVENVMLGNTWVVVVPSIVWIAILEPTKTNRVRLSVKCV